MERNFEVVPDRFQISEMCATKKLRTKRANSDVNCTRRFCGLTAEGKNGIRSQLRSEKEINKEYCLILYFYVCVHLLHRVHKINLLEKYCSF
jgi:hypothetical protein